MLGVRLLERTPRRVRLTGDGERFLDPARKYVKAGRDAIDVFKTEPVRLAIGITHHLIGSGLPHLLRLVGERETGVTLHLRTGGTRTLLDLYDGGDLDAIFILRHDDVRRDGEVLAREGFGWFCSPDFQIPTNSPLPLVLQPDPCNLRAMALRAMGTANLSWREVFVGTGAAAVGAAAEAGIGIALMARSAAPSGAVEVEACGLPQLPQLDVMLISNVTGDHTTDALRRISKVFRASGPLMAIG
jgi:DNA-binding transcriptional LysR family regulator